MDPRWASEVGKKVGFLVHLFLYFLFFPITVYLPHLPPPSIRHPLHFLRSASIVSDFAVAGRKERVQNHLSDFGPSS